MLVNYLIGKTDTKLIVVSLCAFSLPFPMVMHRGSSKSKMHTL